MEYYSTIKKNGIRSFARKWMELKMIVLSKISQAQKDRMSHVFTYMQNLDQN
jgi:hypothetical protein